MGAFMSSFRTFQCAQPLNVLVLGLALAVDPEFPAGISDPNFSGSTTVAMLVDANGRPQQVHVARSLGAAFDEKCCQGAQPVPI